MVHARCRDIIFVCSKLPEASYGSSVSLPPFTIGRLTWTQAGTTVTLNNDVLIETVSKMIGHKNPRTTRHYAKLLDKKVSRDMHILRDKLRVKAQMDELKAAN